jgi:hypothetical protein
MLCSSTTVIARSLHRKMCSFQMFPTEGFPLYPIEISPCLPMFPRPTAPGVCECYHGIFLSITRSSPRFSCFNGSRPYSDRLDLTKLYLMPTRCCPMCPEVFYPYYLSMLPCLCTLTRLTIAHNDNSKST